MIGYIRGKILAIGDNYITLGESVGYSVNTSISGYSVDDEVELFTHMVVRENDISLWGFKSQRELDLFKLLINVSGVGPRTSQNLINNVGFNNVISSITNENPSVLKTTGIGLKTAQKIVLELKGKLKHMNVEEDITLDESFLENTLVEEVILALKTLGYRESDLQPIVYKILKQNPELTTPEEVIKKVLTSI